MKYIEITEVPKGANVLIAHDDGSGVVTKENEIDLYKYDGDGQIDLNYSNAENIIVRVRCANEEGGFWRPLEINTAEIEPGETFIVKMEEDKFLGSKPRK